MSAAYVHAIPEAGVVGNLASPVFGTPSQNNLAILEPQVKYAEGFWHPAVHPLRNLASGDGSVRIGLLTLVSVMVNLRDNLKSVWCATSEIYRKSCRLMQDYAAQIEVRRSIKRLRTTTKCRLYLANGTYPEAMNFYATLQGNRELAKALSLWV